MTVPYTTPITAVAGYNLSDEDWNDGVRDSLESLAKPPRAAIARATPQSIPNNVVTIVTWSAEGLDSDEFWSPGSPDHLTIPAGLGGIYLVTFSPIWDINGLGGRYGAIAKNGTVQGSPVNTGGSSGWYVQQCITVPVHCVPGDVLQGYVYQSSGGALDLRGDVYPMTFTATRIGVA